MTRELTLAECPNYGFSTRQEAQFREVVSLEPREVGAQHNGATPERRQEPGTMNEQEVNRQIHQMVQFIKQEAEEKANEIRVAAEEVRPRALFFSRHATDAI